MSLQDNQEPRFANYGKPWGEAAARCLRLDEDLFGFDEEDRLRLMPIPECFRCPISQDVMIDPVATVDGAVYERSYIEQWFRQKAQKGDPATSPATGMELRSKLLLPLVALQKAVEAYLINRPELHGLVEEQRSHKEAARLLQEDLGTKRQEQVAKLKNIKEHYEKLQQENDKLKRESDKLQRESDRLKKVVRGLLTQLRESRRMCSRIAEERSGLAEQVKSLQQVYTLQKKRKAIETITSDCLAQSLLLVNSRAQHPRGAIAISEADGGTMDLDCISLSKASARRPEEGGVIIDCVTPARPPAQFRSLQQCSPIDVTIGD